jgi:hypothetical protein
MEVEKSIGGFNILGSDEVALIIDVQGLLGQTEHERETAIAVTANREDL